MLPTTSDLYDVHWKRLVMHHIPVISINLSGLEENPGFKITLPLVLKGMYAVVFGDIFMRALYRVRPYEAVPGSANALHEKWKKKCIAFVQKKHPGRHKINKMCKEIIEDFDNLPMLDIQKPRVGIVGEILVKFLPAANNYLVELLEQEGAEAVVPDLLDFFLYCFYNSNFKAEKLGMKKATAYKANLGIKALEWFAPLPQKHLRKVSTLIRRRRLQTLQIWQKILFLSEIRPEKAGS